MASFMIFQCLPCYKHNYVSLLSGKLFGSDCRIILDLEDAIKNVTSENVSKKMKESAREELKWIIVNCPQIQFDLRINKIGTDEYKHDMDVLKYIKTVWKSIFIPKVECSDEISCFISDLGKLKIRAQSVNVIIESREGLEFLDKIFAVKFKMETEYIFFGNYDYHLDCLKLPVAEQNTDEYWSLAEEMIHKVEKLGFKFGNSAYVNLYDEKTLKLIVTKLRALCRKNFALISLHSRQTKIFQLLRNQNNKPAWVHTRKYNPAKTGIALILKEYQSQLQKGRSFAISKSGRGKIITPQEYQIAMKLSNGEKI